MDQAMHHHWLVAERRIDIALAGLTLCGLWLVCLPIIVLLTDAQWTQQYSLAMVSSVPIAVVFAGLLWSSLRVARAIEDRDQSELAEWRTTLVTPGEPDLLQARLRRIHYPMLGVIVVAALGVGAVAGYRLANLAFAAQAGYVRGILLIAVGVALSVGVLMLPVTPRVQLRLIVLVAWTVPVGGALCGLTLILDNDEIAGAVNSPSMTTFVLVIVGILFSLLSLMMACFWVAWVGRMLRGRSLLINEQAREVPEVSTQYGVADPEFDQSDLSIVSQALVIPTNEKWLGGIIVASTAAIFVLSIVGLAGTPAHGAVAAVLTVATVVFVYRLRSAV